MRENNFVKFYPTRGSGFYFEGISVKEKYIILSKPMKSRLTKTYIKFEYDSENKVIKIIQSDKPDIATYKISKSESSSSVMARLSKVMPIGRYIIENENGDEFIFKLEELK